MNTTTTAATSAKFGVYKYGRPKCISLTVNESHPMNRTLRSIFMKNIGYSSWHCLFTHFVRMMMSLLYVCTLKFKWVHLFQGFLCLCIIIILFNCYCCKWAKVVLFARSLGRCFSLFWLVLFWWEAGREVANKLP